MNVLFLGTTGLEKTNLLEQLGNYACKMKYDLPTGLKHDSAPDYIQIFDIDNRIRKNLLLGYTAFMDSNVRDDHITAWKTELEMILKEINQTKPKNVFLSAHAVYFRYNNYFTMINQNTLTKFHPDIIITLLDDIYDVSKKVADREKTSGTNSSCTLSEALGWRTVETLMADYLAENLFIDAKSMEINPELLKSAPPEISKLFGQNIPHYILAVKHKISTFYKLLFERKRLILYSSFPITSTRTNLEKIEEINSFKKKLDENYTVLDPATIDEILVKDKKSMEKEEYEYLKKNNLIFLENENTVVLTRLAGDYSRSTQLPDTIKIEELQKINDPILKHVENRDYRMVKQSDGVVAYRPFWGEREDPAGGVDRELQWALDSKKAALAYHPDEDGNPKLMFKGIDHAVKRKTIDEIFKELKGLQDIKIKQMEKEPETWEQEKITAS